MYETPKIRNIAIIAHVDHGKTTLVDGLLKQSGLFRENQIEMSQSLIMDNIDQEKERGITINAKNASIFYKDYKINIIDTPGHADFSGEVERTINMAQGCLLLVDAAEGPMPQTKFVLQKALENNLKVIVVINKIDKSGLDIKIVEDKIADLFLELVINEDQLHYETFYAISREGKSWDHYPSNINQEATLEKLIEGIIRICPPPPGDPAEPFQLLISSLDFDNFKGKYVIGRISRGSLKTNQPLKLVKIDKTILAVKATQIFVLSGLNKTEVSEAKCGEIVQITGIDGAIGDSLTDFDHVEPLQPIKLEEPTLSIYLGPNTSPFKAREGKLNSSRQIAQRLKKETETNIGIKIEPEGIGFKVSGRGELHLGVLLESLRREGYEFEVGRPQVINKVDKGIILEPIEELMIEISSEFEGVLSTELGKRKGLLEQQFNVPAKNKTKFVYKISTRNMIGLKNDLLTKTKGQIIMHSFVKEYLPASPPLKKIRNGVLISFDTGISTAYSLENAQNRGVLFIGPAVQVYKGQIIGLGNKQDDLEINVCKAKHLTNMRSSSSDGTVQLVPPLILSLEQCLDFIEEDELLEITPSSLRLRKKELDPVKRKRGLKL